MPLIKKRPGTVMVQGVSSSDKKIHIPHDVIVGASSSANGAVIVYHIKPGDPQGLNGGNDQKNALRPKKATH